MNTKLKKIIVAFALYRATSLHANEKNLETISLTLKHNSTELNLKSKQLVTLDGIALLASAGHIQTLKLDDN